MNTEPSKSGASRPIRARLEQAFLKAIRSYTFNTPIDKGKYRLVQLAASLCRYSPPNAQVPTTDGRKIAANPKSGVHLGVYFFGEYEKFLSEIVVSLLRKNDVCLDIGANFGWYTTLFRKHVSESGSVHAFEPVPPTFEELSVNYVLMGSPENVYINPFAVGDEQKKITVNLFQGLGAGHASLSRHGRQDFVSYLTKMVTMDTYLEEKELADVNFAKVDIEGAELMFLKGAESLFRQTVPPIFLMEMALEQTRSFGYAPNDLIKFIGERAPYDFYKADEVNGKLIAIKGFAAKDIGANVFCIPAAMRESVDLTKWL